MKCPKCWTEKAYRYESKDWKSKLLRWLTAVPMKCHHCYHKFHTPWLLTLGQQMLPPAPGTSRARKSS
jgi:hypothetical protein